MAKSIKRPVKSAKVKTEDYLSKRNLVRAINKNSDDLVKTAMEVQGFIIVARDGWIIKEDRDGKVTKLQKVNGKKTDKIALD